MTNQRFRLSRRLICVYSSAQWMLWELSAVWRTADASHHRCSDRANITEQTVASLAGNTTSTGWRFAKLPNIFPRASLLQCRVSSRDPDMASLCDKKRRQDVNHSYCQVTWLTPFVICHMNEWGCDCCPLFLCLIHYYTGWVKSNALIYSKCLKKKKRKTTLKKWMKR